MIYEITMRKTVKFLVEAKDSDEAEQEAIKYCDEPMNDPSKDDYEFCGDEIIEVPLGYALNKYGEFHRPANRVRTLSEILRPGQAT